MPWDKDRYANDPAFRKRVLAKNKVHRTAHKDEINAGRRQKYATDPDFRAMVLASNSLSRQAGKLKKKYGLSLADYNAKVARQGGICPICLRIPTDRLCVDHNHETRTLRSLLCRRCNIGLGLYNDDPAAMRRGADYLDYWLAKEGRSPKIPAESPLLPKPAGPVRAVPQRRIEIKSQNGKKRAPPAKSQKKNRKNIRRPR